MTLNLLFKTTLLVSFTGQVFFAQNKSNPGVVSGNFSSNVQYYNEDTLINAAEPEHKLGANSFANINFNKGNFTAGVRLESYLNPLEGYPQGFNGSGIGYRYANWNNEGLDVTVGNFYDQFGSGMILRIWESRQLGIDNAMVGLKVKYNPYQGVYLKGLIGKHRQSFDDGLKNGNGLVRGLDGEININELFDSTLANSKLKVTIGGSFVSKYNDDNNTPDFILPKNVGAYGGRLAMRYGKFRFFGEYIYKENDPYPDQQDEHFNYIYKNGEGILLNLGYSQKGFSIDLNAKHMDNMLWRSTNATVQPTDLLIGYLPALSTQHTYALAGTLYPYAPNARGEIAFQADVLYKIPKKTKLGGKYGWDIGLNVATAYAPEREFLGDDSTSRKSYSTQLFNMSDSMFFRDINISIGKKINKKLKFKLQYLNFIFDDRAILVAKNHELIYADIAIADLTWKISDHHSLRFQVQNMWTEQDQGNWGFGQIEYSYSPHWFVAVLDQYNYGNPIENQQIHYLLGTAGYIKGPHRFTVAYGRQRAGVFCVGGVCRQVPASNGLTFSITSSF
jgi:hypothetical protein